MIELAAAFIIILFLTYFMFQHNCLLAKLTAPVALASLVALYLYLIGY
ncbi:MAG: hypothetical protein GXO07_04930 [Crenarchaeota archaeon]|nr:hypothetical protein [Thermoproteota archaeon]